MNQEDNFYEYREEERHLFLSLLQPRQGEQGFHPHPEPEPAVPAPAPAGKYMWNRQCIGITFSNDMLQAMIVVMIVVTCVML